MANPRPQKPRKNHPWRAFKYQRQEPGIADWNEVHLSRYKGKPKK